VPIKRRLAQRGPLGHTRAPAKAEDLVQEALARCLRRWRRASANDPVAYVRRVMANAHLTRWRRWGSRVRLGDVPETAADDAGLHHRTIRPHPATS